MKKTLHKWLKDKKANAAVEMALVFPILVTMLFGVVDIGKGLLIDKKAISAAHIASDLLARNISVTDDDVNQAIEAARLAFDPYPTGTFGIDIAGIQFQGAGADPAVIWRDTQNMGPNDEVLTGSTGLGTEDEGVIAVTVVYTYDPPFSGVLTGDIDIQEVAYVRGRITPFVSRE